MFLEKQMVNCQIFGFIKSKDMKEVWKPIVGYEGIYEVSSLGNIRKILINGQFKSLKTTPNNWGYYTIGLRKDGKVKQYRISRLVAEAFIPNPESKPYVDHIDTDKANNKADNLRWVTPSENSNNDLSRLHMLESWQNEERRLNQRLMNLGDKHPRARAVCQLDENGNILQTFVTSVEAAKFIGCKCGNITKCCTGERLRAGGFRWKYA